jgi:hypothetical protein
MRIKLNLLLLASGGADALKCLISQCLRHRGQLGTLCSFSLVNTIFPVYTLHLLCFINDCQLHLEVMIHHVWFLWLQCESEPFALVSILNKDIAVFFER